MKRKIRKTRLYQAYCIGLIAAFYPAQTSAAKQHFGENSLVLYRAYWALKTAQEDIATWTPSGSDTLAEDWLILN
jgi:hypothetical protein